MPGHYNIFIQLQNITDVKAANLFSVVDNINLLCVYELLYIRSKQTNIVLFVLVLFSGKLSYFVSYVVFLLILN